MYRKTYVEINENYLMNNVKNIINYYPGYKYYFGVVKGNAYGHGMHIINALIDGGINYLAVSSLDEALEIRKYNLEIPILCLGYIGIEDITIALKNNVTTSIISYNYFKELIKINPKETLRVHLKINSGLNRLGVNDKNEIKEIVETLEKKDNIYLEGIYTHYATNGVYDIYWDKQTKTFEELTSLIDLNKVEIVHGYNSLSLVKHEKKEYFNGVRLGIAMYGYSSSSKKLTGCRKYLFHIKKFVKLRGKKISKTTITNNLKLRKAFNIYSEVINISLVKKGDIVGYYAKYIADKDILVAVIPIGYADGINRNYKLVKINNTKYSIISICMDYIMVLIDNKVKLHDKVSIIDDDITMSSIATASKINIINALVNIGNRIPRVHIYKDGKKEINY